MCSGMIMLLSFSTTPAEKTSYNGMIWAIFGLGTVFMLASNVMLYTISISTNAGYIFGTEVLGRYRHGLLRERTVQRESVARGANGNSVRDRVHHMRPAGPIRYS